MNSKSGEYHCYELIAYMQGCLELVAEHINIPFLLNSNTLNHLSAYHNFN